jgi:Tfp pilus assembly protein PilE
MGRTRQEGLTFVEAAVLLVIAAILASFAVPKVRASVERGRAAEAFNYLSTIQAAQSRRHARVGAFAADLRELDVEIPTLQHFQTTGVAASDAASLRTRWSQTLVRVGSTSGYGAYTVTFTENGFDPAGSTIAEHPEINPAHPRN